VQDAGEPGVPGKTIVLLFNNGVVGGTHGAQLTGANGDYLFTDLTAGLNYSAKLNTVPAGTTVSPQNQGSDDGLDSDANATGTIPDQQLSSGQHSTANDIGLVNNTATSIDTSIAVEVHADLDRTAVGPNEQFSLGVFGVNSELAEVTGNFTLTIAAPANAFIVDFLPAPFWSCIYNSPGPIQCSGSGTLGSAAATPQVSVRMQRNGSCGTIAPGAGLDFTSPNGTAMSQVLQSVTCSNTTSVPTTTTTSLPAALSGRVWNDSNENGIQDAGEPGIPDVQVSLIRTDGQPSPGMTTLADGSYSFPNVAPGEVWIEVDQNTLPFNYVLTAMNVGGDDLLDSDVDSSGVSATTILDPGEVDASFDVGAYEAQPSTSAVATAPDLMASVDTGAGAGPPFVIQVANIGNAGTSADIVVDLAFTSLSVSDVSGTGWTCVTNATSATCTHAGGIGVAATLPVITVSQSDDDCDGGSLMANITAVPSETNTANNQAGAAYDDQLNLVHVRGRGPHRSGSAVDQDCRPQPGLARATNHLHDHCVEHRRRNRQRGDLRRRSGDAAGVQRVGLRHRVDVYGQRRHQRRALHAPGADQRGGRAAADHDHRYPHHRRLPASLQHRQRRSRRRRGRDQ
jgi:hypothetical protein